MATGSFKSKRTVLLGQDNNALVLLFAVNALVFVGINFIKIIYFLSDTPLEFFFRQVLNWLVLPADAGVLATRPWTLLTHMFTHYSIWQLISSLLWLWSFGFIMQSLAGNNKLIPIYLYGGLVGAFCFVLTNNLFPALQQQVAQTAPLLGAGAAVMAVAIATTTLAPDYRLFPMIHGGIPIWVVTLIYVAIDFSTLASSNTGIAAGHLAAGVTGFFFVRQLRRGQDWAAWMNALVDWLDDLFSPEKKHRKKTPNEKLYYKTDRKPFHKTPNVSQQRLDDILDKINQQGYQFLSEEEKEFLKKASKEDL